MDDEDIRELKREIENLEDYIDELEREFDKRIYKNGDRFTRELGKVKKRLSEVENELGIEDHESMSFHGNSTKMARITSMEEEERKEELNKSLFRASIVWENFDDWSRFTSEGRVIKSGDLRTHLSNYLRIDDFTWAQTYRVMEAFDENTSNIYFEEERDELGRVLVRDPTRDT